MRAAGSSEESTDWKLVTRRRPRTSLVETRTARGVDVLSRSLRDAVCVALLGWGSLHDEPLPAISVTFVLAAAFFWVCYILASKHTDRLVPGQGGLAVALAVGTGLLASLIPYSLELIALRRIEPNVFSILISLEPVFATFFGWLLISEHVGVLKLLAVTLVVSASVLQTLGTPRARRASRGESGGVRRRRVARDAGSRVSP